MASHLSKKLIVNSLRQQYIRSEWKNTGKHYNVINSFILAKSPYSTFSLPHCKHTAVLCQKLDFRLLNRLNAIDLCQSQTPANSLLHWKCLSSKVPENGKNDKEKKKDDSDEKDKVVKSVEDGPTEIPTEPEKLSMTARFKLMYKQYWYVLLPVHVATSCLWLGGFYYLSSSGVDIPALMEQLSISETLISKVKNSSMGHIAIAYLLYKIATPVRYFVTLGGTTLSIKYLAQWGYIKPMPSKEKLRQMYDDRKAKFKQQIK